MKVHLALLVLLFLSTGCTHLVPVDHFAADRALVSAAAHPDESIPILTYHRFGPAATDSTTVTNDTFEYQLQYLSAHDYNVIPLHFFVDWVRGLGPAPPSRSVIITVDDGHESVYTDMLPIIRRYRVPVTLFIYPSAISNASYAMTWDQLKELKDSGLFDIQSHTYWHPNFNEEKKRLNASQYEELVMSQLTRSREKLQTTLGTSVDLLAWPFGIFNDDLIARARQAGYAAGFALGGRRATRMDNVEAIPRFEMTDGDRDLRFQRILGEIRTAGDPKYEGTVVDGMTAKPIEGATVTLGGNTTMTDKDGTFRISGTGSSLRARAPGYLRHDEDASAIGSALLRIELVPFTPKALYLSFFGIGSSTLREPALKLIDETELNAVVIDVKGDRGMLSFKAPVPLAAAIDAEKRTTIRDIQTQMALLKNKGIYTIARIVVFKDDPLARARNDLAVKSADGALWHDREGLAWTDPSNSEVWDYNIAIAVAAAEAGFDEIQLDYVRFPDASGLLFSVKETEETRVKTISQFLLRMRQSLTPYNVFLSADVFGYVCWNADDTGIGQRLEDLAPLLDYVSPMLYPSAFQFGIPGFPKPLDHPSEIVSLSLESAQRKSGLPAVRFRPWLQAFPDYAFDRRPFDSDEIRIQIDAAENFHSNGWMLWDPRNKYSGAGLIRNEK
jgi:peptidoglycan/xylan/chitin deacetylase (PgdA/CDA1 family)